MREEKIGTVESAEIEMEDVIAVIHADKTITLEPVKKYEINGSNCGRDKKGNLYCCCGRCKLTPEATPKDNIGLTFEERKAIICELLFDGDFDVPDEIIHLVTAYAKIRVYQKNKKDGN